jgi:hypothetical protein
MPARIESAEKETGNRYLVCTKRAVSAPTQDVFNYKHLHEPLALGLEATNGKNHFVPAKRSGLH